MDASEPTNEAAAGRRDGHVPLALLRCRAILARDPGDRAALECYSALLLSLGRFGDAARACGAALAADPTSQAAASGLRAALRGELAEAAGEGRADALVAAADRLIDLDHGGDPDRAAWERAQFRLMAGDFGTGWELFESRLRLPGFIGQTRLLSAPRWDGGPYAGRTLLVHGEQGYGDTIMMLRHLKRAKELGGTLLAFVQPPLAPVAATCAGPDRVFDAVEGAPVGFDVQLPMMSLPYALGVPCEGAGDPGPYLRVPAHVPNRGRIDSLTSGLGGRRKIGLVWAGRPSHRRDGERSIPPGLLSPLAGVGGAAWFALHREDPGLAPFPGATPLGHLMETFADTAHALGRLDLLVTVDTAAAHLAGAMGVPVALLVTCLPDWRWGLARRDSPLYPSARLYRQGGPGDWAGAVAELAADLAAGGP
jgi:hypothetical protein